MADRALVALVASAIAVVLMLVFVQWAIRHPEDADEQAWWEWLLPPWGPGSK